MKTLGPRVTADIEGEFVVVLIGAHLNRSASGARWRQ
jgi:hypothetical protein